MIDACIESLILGSSDGLVVEDRVTASCCPLLSSFPLASGCSLLTGCSLLSDCHLLFQPPAIVSGDQVLPCTLRKMLKAVPPASPAQCTRKNSQGLNYP